MLLERGENIKRGGFFHKLNKLNFNQVFCTEGGNSTIECLAKVDVEATYSPLPPRKNSDESIAANESLTHRFIFTDEDGKWIVHQHVPLAVDNTAETRTELMPGDSDVPELSSEESYARLYQKAQEVNLNKFNSAKLDIKEEFDETASINASARLVENDFPFVLAAVQGTYNHTAAVNYALAWVDPVVELRNPNYFQFNNNCTNYTSQALEAGGWLYNTGWYRDNASWWSNVLNNSWPWAAAENFWQHAYAGNRATLVNSFCDLQPGDIISADWDGDLHVQHTMIVTKKVGCELFVSYHSNDRENKMFRDLLADPDANYWGWKITGISH